MTNPRADTGSQTASADETQAFDPSTSAGLLELQKAFDQILNEVIVPVSGDLDGRVTLSTSTEPPTIILDHVATTPKGAERHFRYEIKVGTPRLELSEIPAPNEPRILGFPSGPYNPKELLKLQDAFRSACIDDPVLYSRFHRREFKLEDYQEAAVKAGLLNLRETKRAFLVLGTGAGKTEIAFEIAAQELNRAASLDQAAVLFVVNNNIILSEAAQKFDRRFGEVYSKSHAHGGQKDTSGHLVVATPGTILGEQRLEEFLATRKQVLIVFDEAHHSVADQHCEIMARAIDFAKKNGLDLSFLGMTATETRPDLKNVLRNFHDHISFELPAAELTARGFLAPFRYHAHDTWLYSGAKAPQVILPDDEMAPERRELLKSEAAFPHIAQALEQHTLSKDDKRTLVVAPGVELAGQLVSYLNQMPEYAGQVVRLTSADKDDRESYVRFSHAYEAWKTGAWPKDSPFADEPVPMIVVSVDLFKEGADAPGVRTIINWADTNSLITFLQTLGRGLRPDPFKECLDVVDLAGTFRKVHLLQWLGDITESRKCPREGGRHSGELDSRFTGAERQLCDLADEVSGTVKAFLADVPQTLARRYPGRHHSALPIQEIERLHECISSRLGFNEAIEFERFMRELGEHSLAEEPSLATIADVRRKLAPAFFSHASDVFHDGTLVREPATLLVHAHLLQTLRTQKPDLNPAHFVYVFPEFSPEVLEQGRLVGSNLALLRRRYFGLTGPEMYYKLRAEAGRISDDDDLRLLLFDLGGHEADVKTLMAWIEGRQGIPDPLDQKAIIEAYLHHPEIQGKLCAGDFRLPRLDFENVLIQNNLIKIHAESIESRREFLQLLTTNLDKLWVALEAGDAPFIARGLEASSRLLGNLELHDMMETAQISSERFSALKSMHGKFERHLEKHERMQEIRDALQSILDKACARIELPVRGVVGCSVSMQQEPGRETLQFSLEIRGSSGAPEVVEQVTLPIKRDLQRVHIVLSSKLLWTLDKVAETMSDEQRQSLAETVRILVEAHAARLGDVQKDGQDGSEFPVLIYPRTARFDNPASFESKLSDQLFNETRLDILIGGASVTGLGDSYNLLPSIPHALSSRVSEVTEDFIQYATTLVRAGGRNTFVAQLCHNYKIVQFARDHLSLHANHWKQLFETSLNQESLRHLHVARQPLDRLFRPDASIDAERFSSLKAYCDLLDAVSRDGGFTPDSTLFLATWAVYDRFPLGSYDQKDSPLRKVNAGLTRFFSTLVDAYSHGRTPAEAVQASTREILTVIFNSLFEARYDVPALFSDVATDQQAVYADQFAEKIRETSGALAELLSSIDKTPDRPEKGSTEEAARLEGHPFFNADREPVLFLSGTAKKPVGHVDPDCAVRQKWLEKPRKNGLPTDPLTMDQIESAIGKDRRSVECCQGCHTPTWSQQQHYDDVKARFRYNSAASARLPTHLKSVV